MKKKKKREKKRLVLDFSTNGVNSNFTTKGTELVEPVEIKKSKIKEKNIKTTVEKRPNFVHPATEVDLMYLTHGHSISKKSIIKQKKETKQVPFLHEEYDLYKNDIKNIVEKLFLEETVDTEIQECFKEFIHHTIEFIKFRNKKNIIQNGLKKVKPIVHSMNEEDLKKFRKKLKKTNKSIFVNNDSVKSLPDYIDIKLQKKKKNDIFLPKKMIIKNPMNKKTQKENKPKNTKI